MLRFEQIWDKRHRKTVLLLSGLMILTVAAVDWWTKSYIDAHGVNVSAAPLSLSSVRQRSCGLTTRLRLS